MLISPVLPPSCVAGPKLAGRGRHPEGRSALPIREEAGQGRPHHKGFFPPPEVLPV